MYWSDVGLGKIRRANLGGSDVEDIISRPDLAYGIALIPGPATPVPVGGVGELLDVVDTSLESPGSPGTPLTDLLWAVAAITAGTFPVVGGVWYARSRRRS